MEPPRDFRTCQNLRDISGLLYLLAIFMLVIGPWLFGLLNIPIALTIELAGYGLAARANRFKP